MTPRVEQRNDVASLLIERADVATLPDVAPKTGIGQVVRFGASTVLPADDVIHAMREVCVVLVQQAVFATMLGSLDNELTQSPADITAQVECVASRGLSP